MKRVLSAALILALALTCFTGCGKAPEEETASIGEYVAGDSSENRPTEENGPVKVENQSGGTVTETRDNGGTQQNGSTNNNSSGGGASSSNGEQSGNAGGTTTNDQQAGNEKEETKPDVQYDPQNKLKIVSFNLMVSDGAGELSIATRAPLLKATLEPYDADIMGFCEVGTVWMDGYLLPYYSGKYDHILKYRSSVGVPEGTPLFWKKDKFTCLDKGYFWLSDTPDMESISWNSDCYRICTWAKLKVKATGKEFLYFNTHFDYRDTTAEPSAKLTAQRASKLGGFSKLAVICGGDFNFQKWSPGYVEMLKNFLDVNEETEQNPYHTGHDMIDGSTGSIIDYVFCSQKFCVPLSYKVIDDKPNGNFISDHYGLFVEIALT